MEAAQALTALSYGNKLRLDGARFCSEVSALECAEGRALLAECLGNENRPEAVDHLRVERFVRAVNRIGPDKAKRMLQRAAIHRTMGVRRDRKRRPLQVRDLTEGECRRLAEVLRSGLRVDRPAK